jgi:hypothetical protein
MRIDFGGVNRPSKGLLPESWYEAEVRTVQPKQASTGQDYWRVEFEVVAGDHSGTRVFDSLFFTEKAFPRLKLALSAFGLPHEGVVDIAPEDLVGRHACIEVTSKEGTDQKVRNVVTFEGYRPATAARQKQTVPVTPSGRSPGPSRGVKAPPDEEDAPF